MADISADQQKFLSALEMWGSAIGANSKSATALKVAEEGRIKQIMKLTGLAEEDARAMLKKIKAEEESAKRTEAIAKGLADSFGKALNSAKALTEGALNATQSVYNSSEVFAATIPTLQLLGNAIKAVTEIISTALSGIPIIGSVFTAADKAMALVVDLTTKIMEAQIQNAQQYLNTYNAISKAGFSFAGNLEKMRDAAAAGGLPLREFSKFLTENIEKLSRFGGSMTAAALSTMGLRKEIIANRDNLLVMYGSYEALDSALSSYSAQLAGYGLDLTKNSKLLKDSSASYLTTLKQLTELTGISAAEHEKEVRERQMNLTYQTRLQEMIGRFGTTGVNQLEQAVTMMGKYLSPEAQKAAIEAIAQGGVGMMQNPDLIKFVSQMPALGNLIENLRTQLPKITDPNEAQRVTAEAFARFAREQAAEPKRFVGLTAPGLDPVIDQVNRTTANILANSDTLSKLTGETLRIQQLQETTEKTKPEAVKEVANAYRAMIEIQKQIDAETAKNIKNVGYLVNQLYTINKELVDKFTPMFGTAVTKFSEAVDKLLIAAGLKAPPAAPPGTPTVTVAPSVSETGVIEGGAMGEGDAGAILEAARRGREERERARKKAEENSNTSNLSMPTKGAEATAGGAADQIIVKALNRIHEKYPGAIATALNDTWHQTNRPGSRHVSGAAADITGINLTQTTIDEINKLLKDLKVKAERHVNEAGAPGHHLHIEKIKEEPDKKPEKVGSATADADTRLAGLSPDISSKLDELITLTRDHRDITGDLFRAMS